MAFNINLKAERSEILIQIHDLFPLNNPSIIYNNVHISKMFLTLYGNLCYHLPVANIKFLIIDIANTPSLFFDKFLCLIQSFFIDVTKSEICS